MKKSHKTNLKKNPLTLISLIALILFIIISIDVSTTKQILKLDDYINKIIPEIQTPLITKIFIIITNFGETTTIIILTIILSSFLLIRKKYSHLILLILSMAIGLFLELSLKNILHRLRPENALIEVTRFSFPSGHATMATIFFTILLYALIENLKNKKIKMILAIITLTIIFLISFSRIYLGVHWFSDVLAGFILGILINSIMLLLIEFIYKKK